MGLFSRKPPAPAAGDLRRERRALVLLREERLRDLGGLTLEMYRRDHFNEALLTERCAELVAIEARVSEIDALASPALAGVAPVRAPWCSCGAPLLIGARLLPELWPFTRGRRLRRAGPGDVTEETAPCPRCDALIGRGQEYCVECGVRLHGSLRVEPARMRQGGSVCGLARARADRGSQARQPQSGGRLETKATATPIVTAIGGR